MSNAKRRRKSLEERIQRLEDIQEIHNLMGRYEYLASGGMFEDILELYAEKTPGVSIEIYDWGVYLGLERIKEFLVGLLKMLMHVHGGEMKKLFPDANIEKDNAGLLMEHDLTTPVIEVAGDGKTAKGVWISPGFETLAVTGKLQAYWVWGKYGVDFVKEEGKWKFWHFHIYKTFYTPVGKSWVEKSPTPFDAGPPPGPKPDRPSKYHYEYGPLAVPQNVPAPPEPYETFGEKTAY